MEKKEHAPIVYIITKLELGGAQKVCLALFQELQKQDHPTWLISGTEGTLVPLVKDHPRAILLSSLQRECSFFGIFNECKSFFTIARLLKKLKKEHPSLMVHTHSTKAGYLGRWAAFFAGIKNRVHTVHGFGFHDHQSPLIYSIAYLLEWVTSFITTHYICVSSEDIRIGLKRIPGFACKNSLIRAAVEDHKFTPAQTTTPLQETFIFGTVSCFKKQKNLLDLLTSFTMVHKKHPNTHLAIIGDGAERPYLESWIAEHALQKAITLHGWVDNVADYMKTWNAFVMTSLWEGLPCAAVEARFLKLPVLAYHVGGIHDIIIPGKNGFLFEPKNSFRLAEGMTALLTDPQLYKQLTEHTEDLSSFTIPAMIGKHKMLYKNLK